MTSNSRTLWLAVALTIPSFYGALTWGCWLLLYELRLIAWEPTSPLAAAVFLCVFGVFAAAFLTAYGPYRRWHDHELMLGSPPHPATDSAPWVLVAILHSLGFLGLALYISKMAGVFGGLRNLIGILALSSYQIRWEAEITASLGTQLSYLGWLAIGITIHRYRQGYATRLWLVIALLQLLGNLIYIDRTRPMWIFFTAVLMWIVAKPVTRTWRAIVARVVIICAIFVGLFLGIAAWVGKVVTIGQYGESPLPPAAQNIYLYGTSGFAYFNRLLDSQEAVTYVPERILYPAFKVLASLGLSAPPPSQINSVFYVPFPANLGTFLEPFYRDGGFVFLLLGVALQSFGLDLAGYSFLRNRGPVARFAWANLCFVAFIGFLTPKLAAFPIWLFAIFGVVSVLLVRKQTPVRSVLHQGMSSTSATAPP